MVGAITNSTRDEIFRARIRRYAESRSWVWTGRKLYFLTDFHADADAFLQTLASVGAIKLTNPATDEFELLDLEARYVIGGDCLNKGPNNFRLLDAIHQLTRQGADLILLAGNHDVRTCLGFRHAGSDDPLLGHLFAGMGRKSIPLLKEIHKKHVKGGVQAKNQGRDHARGKTNHQQQSLPTDKAAFHNLFPDDHWHDRFKEAADDRLRSGRLAEELVRVREKSAELEFGVRQAGLDIDHVHSAIHKFRELFFDADGQYRWFFDRMKLVHQEGSYLFVHAGVDNKVSKMIRKRGVDIVNGEFRHTLASDPFELYYGPLGNMFLTRYRSKDLFFSPKGVKRLSRAGIHAIVHGHKSINHGQRLIIRKGMLNIECDASVDCNTRRIRGLQGPGGAVVVFSPDGTISALSTDYPRIKTFHPGKVKIVTE